MPSKLKTLIRRATSRKKDDQLDQPNEVKRDTGATAVAAPKTRTPSKLPNAGQKHSVPQRNRSTRRDENVIQLSRKPVPISSSHNGVAHIAGDPSVRPDPEQIDRSVVEDYEAYLPVISPVKKPHNTDPLKGKYVKKSSNKVEKKIDTAHKEDTVGDASFDRTLPNISSRAESGPSASSVSNTSSQPSRGHQKASRLSANHTNKERMPAPNTIRIFNHQNPTSVDDSTEKALDEQIKSRGEQKTLNSYEKGMPDFDEHTLQARATAGLLQRVSTNSDTVDAGHQSVSCGQTKVPEHFELSKLDGIIDLKDSIQIHKKTQVAPAVQHETVKPKEHEFVEERIYREIHNHDVYHRILPVHDIEILPARHFVHDSNGELIEVSGDLFPHLSGTEKGWAVVRKKQNPAEITPQRPRQTEPKIIADKVYMTEEGYPRRETTILHPPELEDLTGYEGPVMPIIFPGVLLKAPEQPQPGIETSYDSLPSEKSPWLRELMDGLSGAMNGSHSSSSSHKQETSSIAVR
ncbi:hypothetical protein DM02DRAFT_679320 [Periconia macrospinosa]|uniref:Uncharacterized protein n=1 Tax=Periconia macrospinosa TaxID=97972 RepID=A0A2V1EDE8_9PLEO|nr:hypothetical protein DM02DRAFT_679320 [Periconia macrospinosa]